MSRPIATRSLAALMLAAAAALCAAPVIAQEQPTTDDVGTIYFGQRRELDVPKFWLAPPSAILDLEAIHTRTKTSSSGGTQKTTETLFQEELTLFTHGHIVHPNLVDLRLSVTGGLSQSQNDSGGQSGNTNGVIYGWNVDALFLRNEPSNYNVYSQRTQSTIDVPFGPTYSSTTTRTGAQYNHRSIDGYVHLEAVMEQIEQGGLGFADEDYAEDRYAFVGDGQKFLSDTQTLTWGFGLEEVTYGGTGSSSDEQSLHGSLGHSVDFGDDNRSSLSSGITYTQTTGGIDHHELNLAERLHLYHTPELETNYYYRFQQLTYGNGTANTHEAYMDARHKLYKSLETVGRLGAERREGENNTTDTYTADLYLNYRKKVPHGVLLADARSGYRVQQFDGSGSTLVPDQPVSFVDLDPIEVPQLGAVPESVLIRDAITGRTYISGIDYTVRDTPTGFEIDRVLGGNIIPGDPLLLSYTLDPLGTDQITTSSYGLGTRYQILDGPLAGFTPFARFYGQDQEISGGTAPQNNVRDYAAGLEYQTGDLQLRAEREWYNSTLYPFDAWRYEARYRHRLSSETSFTGNAVYTDTQYSDPDQSSQSLSLNGNVTRRISTRLYVSLYLSYARVESDPGGLTEGFEQGLEASWVHRKTKVYMRLRNSTLDSETSQQDFQYLQVGIRRYF